jgi:hypothetical protein
MIKIVNNHNSRDQDPTVHPDDQAQLYILKVKARPETSMTKTIKDSQRRINIKTRKRSASNSSQHRRQQQGEQTNGPPLPNKGHISSEAGKQAINLNIGDQNQFYQCGATRYCQKQHIWPINMATPKFCPENVTNQKN